MKTLKEKLLSQGNLKNVDITSISEIDSPIPINIKDLKLPSSSSVDIAKPMDAEELKMYMFWKEILENNT